jgi:hypothetical protein
MLPAAGLSRTSTPSNSTWTRRLTFSNAISGRTFKSERSLKQHLISPAHVFECNFCDRTFKNECPDLALFRPSLANNGPGAR